MKVIVIQDPNISMLDVREARIYGAMKMEDIHTQMKIATSQNNVELDLFQSNFEGEIVDKIQGCLGIVDGIIINVAGYAHTSVAIRDAISVMTLPTIEVHISNVYRREEFRQKSLIAPVCSGSIVGFGPSGYHLALVGIAQICEQVKNLHTAQAQQMQVRAQN